MNDRKINVTRSSMPPLEEYVEEIREIWDSHWLTLSAMGQSRFSATLIRMISRSMLPGLKRSSMNIPLQLLRFMSTEISAMWKKFRRLQRNMD